MRLLKQRIQSFKSYVSKSGNLFFMVQEQFLFTCVVLTVIMFMSWVTGNPFESIFVVNYIEMFHCICTGPD